MLRHHPKWMEVQKPVEKTTAKRFKTSSSGYSCSSNPSTPINIEEDDNNIAYNPFGRPPGRKIKKRKMKQTISTETTTSRSSRVHKEGCRVSVWSAPIAFCDCLWAHGSKNRPLPVHIGRHEPTSAQTGTHFLCVLVL